MRQPQEFPYDAFLSHSAKDKAVVRVPSLSASNGEGRGEVSKSVAVGRTEGVVRRMGASRSGVSVERRKLFGWASAGRRRWRRSADTPLRRILKGEGYGTRRSVSKSGTED